MSYSQPTRALFALIRDLAGAAWLLWSTIVAAVILAFVWVTLLVSEFPPPSAGDLIARHAKEAWSTVITSARINRQRQVVLRTWDGRETRDVILADAVAPAGADSELRHWDDAVANSIEHEWGGNQVVCYADMRRGPAPSVVHVVALPNTWLNATAIESGWLGVPARGDAVVDHLRELQREAQAARRGMHRWLNPTHSHFSPSKL